MSPNNSSNVNTTKRVENTRGLALTLKQLRTTHPQDGKILTAEELSLKLGKNRAWISQIESRRLKTIKYNDIEKIIDFLLDSQKAEQLKEMIKFNIDTNSFNILVNTMQELYHKLDMNDKENLLSSAQNLANGLLSNPHDTIYILNSIDFVLLGNANEKEHKEIMHIFSNFNNKLDSLKKDITAKKLQCLANKMLQLFSDGKKDSNNLLLYYTQGLVLVQKISQSNLTDSNRQEYIIALNKFVFAIKKLSPLYFSSIPMPFLFQELSTNAQNSELQQTALQLQEYLSSINEIFFEAL